MTAKIKDEIQKMSKITLNQQDSLGKGQYGQVYRYEIDKTPLAVKCFKTEEEAKQERDIIETIQAIANDCPGIIQYYGMKQLQIEIKGLITQNYMGYALFIQQCSCDLEAFNQLPMNEIINLLSQISLTLFCLHNNGCFHGDMKPANILVNNENQPVLNYYLTDYGQGKCIQELISTNFKTISLRGTPFYLDPQLWQILNTRATIGYYNPLAADIYALGIICLELILGQKYVQQLNMFRDQEQKYNNQLQNIQRELLKKQEFQNNTKNPLLMILLKMISFNQKDRPQAIEVCQALISAQFFSMDALTPQTMKALIVKLISSFTPKVKTSKPQQPINPIPAQIQIIPKAVEQIKIPTFDSKIIKKSAYSSLILSLFEDSSINLSRIHYQQITTEFDVKKFHSDCYKNQGSTLVILHSNNEPNSFFGGMAVPSWQSLDCEYVNDPADQWSWLFKIELEGKQVKLHQWKCTDKTYAIYCHKIFGPCFGYGGEYGELEYGGLGRLRVYYDGEGRSEIITNNKYYQKLDLASQMENEKSLLFELTKTMNIDCPAKLIGGIMNEKEIDFPLNECEVFAIKK